MDEIKANTPTKYLKNIWYFLFAAFCICWFILPLGCGPYPQLVEGQLEILYPFSLPFNARKYFHIYFLRYSLFSAYLIPITAILFLIAGFLDSFRKKKNTPFISRNNCFRYVVLQHYMFS